MLIINCVLVVIIAVAFLDEKMADSYVCGPSKKCSCFNKSFIDCSKSMTNLASVCKYIGNDSGSAFNVLDMGFNNISIVHKEDFIGCENLIEIDLSNNGIQNIEYDAFGALKRIKVLNLQRNALSWVYSNFFSDLVLSRSLKTIMLNGNVDIVRKNCSYPSLQRLDQLETLCMDGLPDTDIPFHYKSLTQLQTLKLSGRLGHCSIPMVKNTTFKYLLSVRFLNLAVCKIRDVDAGAFQSLRYLEELDLSENMLLGFRSLRNVSYSLQFTSIKKLNYSKIHSTYGAMTILRQENVCYLRNTNLLELDISRNRLNLIEINTPLLFPDSLEKVRIEDNVMSFGFYMLQLGCAINIEEIIASYQNKFHDPRSLIHEPSEEDIKCPALRFDDCPYMNRDYLLNISKSKESCPFFSPGETFHYLPTPTFPQKLRKIDFSQCNMVYTIPRYIVWPLNNSIEYLNASNNILQSLNGPVGPFPNLRHLDLSQCHISNMHVDTFIFCKLTLESLKLQQNALGQLLSDFKIGSVILNDFANLKLLNLSANFIPSLPWTFLSGVKSLETLDLSVNNIEKWTINVNNLTNLINLNLRSNFFQSLPSELLQKMYENSIRLNKSFEIDLRNNSITLNCQAVEFFRLMVHFRQNMLGFDEYIFVNMDGKIISPGEFAESVQSMDKTCASYTLIIVFCSIGLSVYLAILIGAVIYRNRWNLRYILRNAKVRHFRYKRLNEVENIQYRYDAFISYANENFRFIKYKVMPGLENEGLKLCLHDKDFLPGNNIADNIVEAISNSRKTIAVISKAFVQSKWCLYEFNMARMESIYTRDESGCLIVVILEDVSSQDLTKEMLEWIRSNTYLEYSDNERDEQIFWDLLKDSLE